MNKCNCYYEEERVYYDHMMFTSRTEIRGYCNGTRERDECSCGGDRTRCDFYPEVREKALKEQEPNFGEWISVKDRLPTIKEHHKDFLCRCVLDDDNTQEYAYCLVLKWYVYDIKDGMTIIRPHFEEDGHNMNVTHWTPLPKPPKGE